MFVANILPSLRQHKSGRSAKLAQAQVWQNGYSADIQHLHWSPPWLLPLEQNPKYSRAARHGSAWLICLSLPTEDTFVKRAASWSVPRSTAVGKQTFAGFLSAERMIYQAGIPTKVGQREKLTSPKPKTQRQNRELSAVRTTFLSYEQIQSGCCSRTKASAPYSAPMPTTASYGDSR
jgi:hypothetical protein